MPAPNYRRPETEKRDLVPEISDISFYPVGCALGGDERRFSLTVTYSSRNVL
ncbi:hypothetical protein IG631_08573 [Alternaria alternata]|nr:hypothetical protein IG631_08573 [Alternaria alternata]